MLVRVSHPATPTKLVDLGPASGRLTNFDQMRKTVDQQRAWVRPSHPTHNVALR